MKMILSNENQQKYFPHKHKALGFTHWFTNLNSMHKGCLGVCVWGSGGVLGCVCGADSIKHEWCLFNLGNCGEQLPYMCIIIYNWVKWPAEVNNNVVLLGCGLLAASPGIPRHIYYMLVIIHNHFSKISYHWSVSQDSHYQIPMLSWILWMSKTSLILNPESVQ